MSGRHIGVLVNTIYSDYSVAFLNAVKRYCAENDWDYYVFPLEHGKNSGIYDYHCETLLGFISKHNIEGLVVASATLAYDKEFNRVLQTVKMLPPIPKVSVGFKIEGIPSIKIDPTDALRKLVFHLVDIHKAEKFLVIRCAKGNFQSDEREKIIVGALAEKGIDIDDDHILNGSFLFNNANSVLHNYLRTHGKDFDAIVCLNDSMALGAYQCLTDNGYDVPKDVLLTGFDNVFETSAGEFSFTTIDQNIENCVMLSLATLSRCIAGERVAAIETIHAEPVFRNSCGCNTSGETVLYKDRVAVNQRRYKILRMSDNQLYMLHYFLMETQTPIPLDSLYSRLHYSLCLFDVHGFILVLYDRPVYYVKNSDFCRPSNAKVLMTFFNEGSFERPDISFNPNLCILPPEISKKVRGGWTIYPIYAESYQYGYILFEFGRYERIFYQSIFELISKEIVTSIKITGEQTEKNSLINQNINLEVYSEKMQKLSFTDEMTGLLNRRGFYEMARRKIESCIQAGGCGLVIFCDMDGLKKINDTYGHDVGDRAIKCEARVLKSIFRSTDIVGRLGGDEFAVIAADMKPKDFPRIKKALDLECEKINFSSLDPFVLSVSVGFSEFNGVKCEIEELLNTADSSQYKDKRAKKEAEIGIKNSGGADNMEHGTLTKDNHSALWSGRFKEGPDAAAVAFETSIHVDERMALDDIQGSLAHAEMLSAVKIISKADFSKIKGGLLSIKKDLESGALKIDYSAEDIHSFIEATLTDRVGEAGKKLHTGRSRNDQIALDERIYLRRVIPLLQNKILTLIGALSRIASKNADTLMPGYTHMQHAQPVTLGQHVCAWAWSLERDWTRLEDALGRISLSPLGSGALAGSGLPLDRDYTAKKLGFAGATQNSIDSVSDRDYCIEFTGAFSLLQMHLSRFCEEIVLWATSEFSFINLSEKWSTGSSIMPQKKNPDFAELIRGRTGKVYGDLFNLMTMMKGLPLAYDRDLQEDKAPLFDALDTVSDCLTVFTYMISSAAFNKKKMAESCESGYLNATDVADYLVRKGVPFREAHGISARAVRIAIDAGVKLEDLSMEEFHSCSKLIEEDIYNLITPAACAAARTTKGGAAPAMVKEQVKDLEKIVKNRTKK